MSRYRRSRDPKGSYRESHLRRRLGERLQEEFKTEGWWAMIHGSQFGQAGAPDFIGCYRGIFVAIECKNPKGKLTALQKLARDRIKEAGGYWILAQGPTVHEVVNAVISTIKSLKGD